MGNTAYLPKSMFESPENMNKRLFLEIQKTNSEYSKNTDDHIIFLLSKIDINTCNEQGENLIHIFTKNCKIKSVKEENKYTYINDYYLQHLFDIGCDINKRDNLGKVPMCYSNNINIDFFIKNKADLTIRDNENHTILYHLSKGYYISYIEPFVKNYTDAIDYDEYIPEERLHKAIIFNDINKVKELLLRKPNFIDYSAKKTYQSHTPLSLACEHCMVEVFYLLLEHGATIYPSLLFDSIDNYKMNYYKIQEGSDIYNSQVIIVDELIKRGASINYQDSRGNSSLHICNTAAMINVLLEGGADINARTEGNGIKKVHNYFHIHHYFCIDADPLMYMTVNMPRIDVFRALFKYGADPNRKNENGHTAFMGIFVSNFLFTHYDTDEKYHELVQLFLDNGADLFIKDNDDYSALDYLCMLSNYNKKKQLSTIRYLHNKIQFTLYRPSTLEAILKSMSFVDGFPSEILDDESRKRYEPLEKLRFSDHSGSVRFTSNE